MFKLFAKKVDKKRIYPDLLITLDIASRRLGCNDSAEYSELRLHMLRLLDKAVDLFNDDPSWDISQLNRHCRPGVLVAFVCYYIYHSCKPEATLTRSIAKAGIRLSLPLRKKDMTSRTIEVSVVLGMIINMREMGLDEEQFIGFKLTS
jgi:hypothetical protein